MKLLVPIIVALLVGTGIGIGVGIMMTKPKVEENKTRISDLEANVEDLQAKNEKLKSSNEESEAAIRKASKEIVRYKNDLSRATDMIRGLSAELKKVEAGQPTASTETANPDTSTGSVGTSAATASGPTVATTEYVVKDGDSLWKIAASELDNGMRYKEILKLNSNLSEDKPLVPGIKIKLPSQ
jgi:nucleoid-associated protein YgaU